MKCCCRKSLRTLLVGIVGIATLGLFTGCHRCCKGKDPEAKIQKVAGYVSDELDLNADQERLLGELTKELGATARTMRSGKQELFASVRAEFKNSTIDQAKLVEQVGTQHQRLHDSIPGIVAKVAALHATLKPEQRKELDKLLEKLEAHHCDN